MRLASFYSVGVKIICTASGKKSDADSACAEAEMKTHIDGSEAATNVRQL